MTPVGTESSAGDATEVLTKTLTQVGDLLSYLRADVGPVECIPSDSPIESIRDGAWLACADLIADSDWLGKVVQATGRAMGTEDAVVAGSIFLQGYAYRLLTLATACLTVGGVVPGSEVRVMAVGLGRGRVSKVAYVEPAAFDVVNGRPAMEAMADRSAADAALQVILVQVVEGHLRPLIASIRQQVRIGERLLWGNVAASASTAFRTMEGCLGSWVEPLGERFFELAPPELQDLGSFLLIESAGKRGWFWERTNCCLYYQIEGHAKCADCSLIPSAERRAAYEKGLNA